MKRITLSVAPEPITESLPLDWVDEIATVKVRIKDGSVRWTPKIGQCAKL